MNAARSNRIDASRHIHRLIFIEAMTALAGRLDLHAYRNVVAMGDARIPFGRLVRPAVTAQTGPADCGDKPTCSNADVG